MQKIERILVALELRESDLYLIEYVQALAKVLNPGHIDFVHVTPTLDPAVLKEGHFTPRDERIEKIMREEVSVFFKGKAYDAHFDVVEGDAAAQILHWAVVKQSDLIIIGRKRDIRHAEITVEKVIRKSPCSVLVVPNGSKPVFDKFLTPVDYSDKTPDIIRFLNTSFDHPYIEAIHFFKLPTGYYKTGKTEEEFIAIMQKNAQETADKMAAQFSDNDNLIFHNVCSEDMDEYEYIVQYARKNSYHMIPIGSKNKTNAAAVLLGSFAEKFIRHNVTIPTLIMKQKGENMNFLKAFLEL